MWHERALDSLDDLLLHVFEDTVDVLHLWAAILVNLMTGSSGVDLL